MDVIADEIKRLGAAIRAMGSDRSILTEMTKEIRRAVPPFRAAIRANALAYLPHRGGLNVWMARARTIALIRRGASNAGIDFSVGRNSTTGRSAVGAADAGMIRHKTFGHGPWTAQSVRPGFVADTLTGPAADEFRDAVVTAVDNAIDRALR